MNHQINRHKFVFISRAINLMWREENVYHFVVGRDVGFVGGFHIERIHFLQMLAEPFDESEK
jgi:hypothetical protein